MQVVCEIPKGTHIYTQAGQPHQTPHDMLVFHDPTGSVQGQTVKVLVDTGASDNFMSDRVSLEPTGSD